MQNNFNLALLLDSQDVYTQGLQTRYIIKTINK